MCASSVEHAKSLLGKLETAYVAELCDLVFCKTLLSELKNIITMEFGACWNHIGEDQRTEPESPHGKMDSLVEEQLKIGRAVNEIGALVSIRCKEMQTFQNYYSRLGFYYEDLKDLPPSNRQCLVISLYLLDLLSSNQLGEFHMAVERLPKDVEISENHLVKSVLELENLLIDGNYNKLFEFSEKFEHPLFAFFMESLLETVRGKIANCLEVSYTSLDTHIAAQYLLLKNPQELPEFVEEMNRHHQETGTATTDETTCRLLWEIKGGRLQFVAVAPPKQEIPSIGLLQNAIGYATELEKIV